MRIEAFASFGFQPFCDGLISFPAEKQDTSLAEVHLITGENGSGKTRLLCALSAALGNSADLDQRYKRSDDSNFVVELIENGENFFSSIRDGSRWHCPSKPWSLKELKVERFHDQLLNFADYIARQINARGIENLTKIIRSPFSLQAYRGTGRVADAKIEAMKPVSMGEPNTFLTFDRPASDDLTVSQGMANLKMVSAMEIQGGVDHSQARATKVVQRFEQAIQYITGRTFTFLVKPQPQVHLVAKWGTMEMQLGTLPDGLRSIIAWLISCVCKLDAQYPDHPDPLDIPMILLLDEPESHLHPAWQRKLLPAAQSLFPNAQIIAATHSPFVISSVNSGWIHILRFNEDGNVRAETPIPCSKGDSYIDAVEDVLGIKEWYDPETENLLERFRSTRTTVLQSRNGVEELKELADQLSLRSESLNAMMVREIAQVHQQLRNSEASR